jgi:putative ABC transport system permease protein
MFRHYLITAARNFAHHKLYSFINIVGLAVGLACAILIALFLRDELSYDRWISGSSHLYRVEMTVHAPGRSQEQTARTPIPLPPLMKEQLPEVTAMTRISPQWETMTVGDRQFSETVLVVDPNFFDVIRLPLVTGDPAQVFSEPESIVLSQRVAKKYFGDASPLGKVVTISGRGHGGLTLESHSLTVSGILRDLPENTHLAADVLVPNSSKADQISQLEKENWWNNSLFGYVQLAPNTTPDQVVTKLGPILDKATNPKELGLTVRTSQLVEFHLTPFRDIHLTSDNYGGLRAAGSLTAVYGFAAIAVLIILVACFNFTNLATARATLRGREIGLRKCVGATRQQLIAQFLGEALLTALIALVLALAFVEILLPAYSVFLDRRIEFDYATDWLLFTGLIAGTSAAGLLSGVYPALVLSSFRPGAMVKTSRVAPVGSGSLRLVLVVMQFAVSIGLGIAALVIFRQIDYAHKIDMGLNRDGVVIIGGESLTSTARESFAQALRINPAILGVTSSSILPFSGSESNSFVERVGEPQSRILVRTMDISPDFPSLYDMRLLAGRLLSDERGEDRLLTGAHIDMKDGKNEGRNILINLAAAGKFGYSATEAIGKVIVLDGSHVTIVGVLGDSKIDGVKMPVQPTVFGYYPDENMVVSVRIRGDRVSDTLAFINKTWRVMAPGFPIQRYFLSDIFEKQFKADETQGNMFAFFVGIAIFIACLGLFGLAAFTVERRTREIGLRKVFGARTRDIVRLLLWQFSIPVLIANVIAWPVAYYYLHHWLESYAYRITLNPLYFLAAGVTALTIAWVTIIAHAIRVARASPIIALRYE